MAKYFYTRLAFYPPVFRNRNHFGAVSLPESFLSKFSLLKKTLRKRICRPRAYGHSFGFVLVYQL